MDDGASDDEFECAAMIGFMILPPERVSGYFDSFIFIAKCVPNDIKIYKCNLNRYLLKSQEITVCTMPHNVHINTFKRAYSYT